MDLDELIDTLTSFRKYHGNVKEVFAMTKLTMDNVEVNLSGWEYVTLSDQVASVAWHLLPDENENNKDRERIVIYTHSMTNSGGDVTLAAARGPQVTPRVNQKPQVNENEGWDAKRLGAKIVEDAKNRWWIGNDEVDPLEGHEGDNKRVGW